MKKTILLLIPLLAGAAVQLPLRADLTLTGDSLADEYHDALQSVLLFAATTPLETRTLWHQALTPVIRHLSDEKSQTLLSEPPIFDKHQEYDLSLALALAEEDETTPTAVTDSLLAIAGFCTAPQRGPYGNKPKPGAHIALGELTQGSRQIERQRNTMTHQRMQQKMQQERRRRQLANRAKRAVKHKLRQEDQLASHAGGQELHDNRRERDIESGLLRERTKKARNTIRQNKKNKNDAVRTEQAAKADIAKKRQEARKRR